LKSRLEEIDWPVARDGLTFSGHLHVPRLLSPSDCGEILAAASERDRFERSVDMAPRGFGVGTYYYFREPLVEPAATLRALLYEQLQPLANELRDQKRSSSILLCYGTGGLNHAHRDIYGEVFFPFQVLLVLNKRGRDFEGGGFVLFDDEPERKRQEAPVSEGDVVIFASRDRFEVQGGRRKKVALRHGMRLVTRGKRYALGIVFHLAE
jgi:hypothetical protein